jgi:hypothetical protein
VEKDKVEESKIIDIVSTRTPQSISPTASAVGTGTHTKKLGGVRTLKPANTL